MAEKNTKKNVRLSIRQFRYEKLKQRLIQALESGTFYQYSLKKQQLLVRTLKRYAKQLFGNNERLSTLSHIRLDKTILLGALTAFTISNSHAQCDQDFVAEEGSTPFALPDIGGYANPTFVDIDNDGDLDAFIGNRGGYTQFFRNTGSAAAPVFTAEGGSTPFGLPDIGTNAVPTFVDIDNDGDLDAFIGSKNGYTSFFRNTGSVTAPVFTGEGGDEPFGLPGLGSYVNPTFVDIDNDGDLDAFIGSKDGYTQFFRNTGSATAPVFTAEGGDEPFGLLDVGMNAAPTFVDIDNDGDLDAFIGNAYGYTQFFRAPCVPPDPVEPIEPIPTMGQWGLLTFCLLMVNLGLMTIKRKEELLASVNNKN